MNTSSSFTEEWIWPFLTYRDQIFSHTIYIYNRKFDWCLIVDPIWLVWHTSLTDPLTDPPITYPTRRLRGIFLQKNNSNIWHFDIFDSTFFFWNHVSVMSNCFWFTCSWWNWTINDVNNSLKLTCCCVFFGSSCWNTKASSVHLQKIQLHQYMVEDYQYA